MNFFWGAAGSREAIGQMPDPVFDPPEGDVAVRTGTITATSGTIRYRMGTTVPATPASITDGSGGSSPQAYNWISGPYIWIVARVFDPTGAKDPSDPIQVKFTYAPD